MGSGGVAGYRSAHRIDRTRIAFAAAEPPFKVEHGLMWRQLQSLLQPDRRYQHVMPAGGALDMHEIAGAKIFDPVAHRSSCPSLARGTRGISLR
jgi:hypothetical protein